MKPYSLIAGILSLSLSIVLVGCTKGPTPGPDKQFESSLLGAATAAGAGAVTGAQFAAGSGPGALVGAGVGFVAGGIHGAMEDMAEENMLQLAAQTKVEREVSIAHEILNDHYRRRIELHPTRDIYPADLFFLGDESLLRPEADALVREIAKLNKVRLPWSRLVVASYVKSVDKESEFAYRLAERRSREIGDSLVRAGIEPRRIEARGVLISAPVLIDPDDDPARYNQAVEIIPVDR